LPPTSAWRQTSLARDCVWSAANCRPSLRNYDQSGERPKQSRGSPFCVFFLSLSLSLSLLFVSFFLLLLAHCPTFGQSFSLSRRRLSVDLLLSSNSHALARPMEEAHSDGRTNFQRPAYLLRKWKPPVSSVCRPSRRRHQHHVNCFSSGSTTGPNLLSLHNSLDNGLNSSYSKGRREQTAGPKVAPK